MSEQLEEIATHDNWSEELDEIFDVADSVNELLGELETLAGGQTTHESEHYNGFLNEFVNDMDEDDLYDLGQKDGEIRLARRLLKVWRGDNV
jgi:hypothetical protein